MNDILKHYGVKGMQWGVRKDKNPAAKLSDTQLKKAVSRLQLERQYNELSGSGGKKAKNSVSSMVSQNLKVKVAGIVTAAIISKVSTISKSDAKSAAYKTGAAVGTVVNAVRGN